MKIAFLAPANVIHTVRWANAIADQGVSLDLLSAHPASPDLSPQVRVRRLPWKAPHGYFANLSATREWLRRLQPDVLHAHFASGYGTLAQLAQYPCTLLSVWGSDVYDFPNVSTLHRRLVARTLRTATHVCSTSHAMARQVQTLTPSIKQLSVIPFGVDTKQFSPCETAPARPDQHEIVIGTVKTLRPKYGIDTLIQGFAGCRRLLLAAGAPEANRLRLRITGDGLDREKLQRLTTQEGIADVTTFTGFIAHNNVVEELRKLDVYAAMSRCESFGVAIIEASATERPVVVSDAGGLPEVVQHGHTGWVVPRENPQALASRLCELVQSPEERHRLGVNGREHVCQQYEWRRCVDQQIALYEAMAREHLMAA